MAGKKKHSTTKSKSRPMKKIGVSGVLGPKKASPKGTRRTVNGIRKR